MDAMDNSPLAPVLDVSTACPFPDSSEQSVGQDCINLRVCSEFTTYISPVTLVDGQHRLALVRDVQDQPMLFSTGNGDRLMCFVHEFGGADSWQSYDVTPSNVFGKVVTFDVQQSSGHLVLAVALHTTGRDTLFTAVCKKTEFEVSNIPWVERRAGVDGPSIITSLLCGSADNTGRAIVTAGIEATASLAATYYQVDTNPSNIFPWVASPLPENAQKILQVVPGRLPGHFRQGYYCLYEYANGHRGCVFQKSDHSLKKEMDITGLADIRDIHSAQTPFSNQTDLFVATSQGIAYFSERRLDDSPQKLLPEVSFRQVVAAEYDRTIVVFGVSDANELFYLEGTRGASVSFKWSGLPIRADVALLSVAYNVHAHATELMYVDTSSRAIHHLWRDPVSFIWHEAALTVRAPKGADTKSNTRSFPAFITSISFVNSTTGESIGPGYRVALSSDLVYVTANDRVCALNKNPVQFSTDDNGRITIVQEVTSALSSPNYTLHLSPADPAHDPITVSINPAQRVIQKLATFTTAESLDNARTTDGRKVDFKISKPENLAAAASVLGQFGGMIQTVDSNAGDTMLPGTRPLTSVTSSYEIDTQFPAVQTSSAAWYENVAYSVAEFFGDVWEAIKLTLKRAFRFAVRVVDRIVTLAIEIMGKVFKFVVDAVGPLVTAVVGFLKENLGLDLSGLLDLLGLITDWEKIKETQRHLIAVGEGMLDSVTDFFAVNRPVVQESLEFARELMSQFVKDTRVPLDVPGKSRQPNPLFRALRWLFDNPVIHFLMKYNPLTWLLRETNDILGDDVRLPDLTPLIRIILDIIPGVVVDQIDIFARLGSSVFDLLQRLVKREVDFGTAITELLGDLFWTIFDNVESVTLAVFDVATKFFVAAKNILTQPIQLPIVTAMWKALTGQDLTIMNVLTLIPSFALNTFYLTTRGKLPFDPAVLGDPRRFLPTKESLKLPSLRGLSADLSMTTRLTAEDLRASTAEGEALLATRKEVDLHTLIQDTSRAPALQPTMMKASAVYNVSLSGTNPLQTRTDAQYHKGADSTHHDDKDEEYHHITEVVVGVISAMLGALEVTCEAIAHKDHDQSQLIDSDKPYSPSKWALIVLGVGQCAVKVISVAVAPGVLNRSRGDGVFVASCAIRLFKSIDVICAFIATAAVCYPFTAIQPSGFRMIGALCGVGISGILEFNVGTLPRSARAARLVADMCEASASVAGSVAVVTAQKNPAVAAKAVIVERVLVGTTTFSSAAAAILLKC